mmetsp:Transcript_96810/g.172235  ORF Transcript_96810/g.172235 Transcript_96810/m.172235 type:complete len:341 (-) Transcript_96810:125-1147(-)
MARLLLCLLVLLTNGAEDETLVKDDTEGVAGRSSTSNSSEEAGVRSREDPSCMTIPDGVIPMMPQVPQIPKSLRKIVKVKFNLTVNYSLYYDPQTQEVRCTTDADLAKPMQTYCMQALNSGVGVLLTLVFAAVYKMLVTDQRPPTFPEADELDLGRSMTNPPHDFHFTLFSCCEDGQAARTCCTACMCPSLRAADTYAAAGLLPFWRTILIFVGIQVAAVLVGFGMPDDSSYEPTSAAFLAIACVFVGYRQALREKLGAPQGRQTSVFIKDWLAWACCQSCVITQEAREVDMAEGLDVKFPCLGVENRGSNGEGRALLENSSMSSAKFPLVGNAVSTSKE